MKAYNKLNILFFIFSLFSLNVFSNNKPVFTSLPVTALVEFDLYNYNISAIDSDNDSIIFICYEKPDWLALNIIDKNHAKLYGGTPVFFDSTYVNIAITDGIDTAYQSFYIHLFCVNDSPDIISSPITSGYVDSLYIYNILGTDAYCDVKFNPIQLPEWLNLNNGVFGSATLAGTPSINDTGIFHIKIEAYRDCEICSSRYVKSFDLKVVKINSPPVINTLPPYSATFFQIYQYNLDAGDADGDSLYFNAEKIPNWLNLSDNKNGTAVLSGVPSTYPDMNDTSVIICVTDKTDTVRQTFNIKLFCIPSIPNVITTPDTLASVNEEYLYLFQATDIESENLMIYCKDLPQWLSYQKIDCRSMLVSGTPSVDNIGLYDISIICKYEIDKPCHDSTFQNYKLRVKSTSDIQRNEINLDMPFTIEQNSNCISLRFRKTIKNQDYQIQLMSLTGEIILNLSTKFIDDEISIETDQIKSGIYILYIRQDNYCNNAYKLFIK